MYVSTSPSNLSDLLSRNIGLDFSRIAGLNYHSRKVLIFCKFETTSHVNVATIAYVKRRNRQCVFDWLGDKIYDRKIRNHIFITTKPMALDKNKYHKSMFIIDIKRKLNGMVKATGMLISKLKLHLFE